MNLLLLARLCRRIRAHRAVGVAFVLGMLLLSILGNAVCFYLCDGPELGIDLGDALWYSAISITTIGYGDLSAVSTGARIGTLIFIVLIGLSAFSVFLGMTIDWVTEQVMKGRRGMGTVIAKDHVLLINVPSERDDITVIEVPGNQIAAGLGDVRMTNMVLLGAMLAVSPLVTLEEAGQALRDHLPERKQHLIEPNIEVLQRGYEFGVQEAEET